MSEACHLQQRFSHRKVCLLCQAPEPVRISLQYRDFSICLGWLETGYSCHVLHLGYTIQDKINVQKLVTRLRNNTTILFSESH